MSDRPPPEYRALVAYYSVEHVECAELTNILVDADIGVEPAQEASFADIGIIDLREGSLSARKCKALAMRLRQKSPDISILIICDLDAKPAIRAAFRQIGEVVIADQDLVHVVTRIKEIIRLRNFVEETGERLKSLATLGRLVDFPPIQTDDSPKRVLLVGAPGPLAMTTLNALHVVADEAHCVMSAGQILRALDREPFDCIVALPMEISDPIHSALRSIQRHPLFNHIVVIHLSDTPEMLCHIAQKGAREFLLQHQAEHDLAPRLKLSIRRSRLSRSMRQFLVTCKGDNVRDPASGAFSARFLTEHGARICRRADQTRWPLSLTYLEFQSTQAAPTGPSHKALHSAARLINRVTRAEDVIARIGIGKFVVLSPATRGHDAAKIADRIKGVINTTAFGATGSSTPETLEASLSTIQREEGQSIEETLATAIMSLQRNTAKVPQERSPQ